MDNKTGFGFETSTFIDIKNVVGQLNRLFEHSNWCLKATEAATQAAIDAWKTTYQELKEAKIAGLHDGSQALSSSAPRVSIDPSIEDAA